MLAKVSIGKVQSEEEGPYWVVWVPESLNDEACLRCCECREVGLLINKHKWYL